MEESTPTDLTQNKKLSIPNETIDVSISGTNTQNTSNTLLSQTPYNSFVYKINLSSQFQESTNDKATIPQSNSPPKTISVYNDNPRKTVRDMHEEAKDENKKNYQLQNTYEILKGNPGSLTKTESPLKYQVCLTLYLFIF